MSRLSSSSPLDASPAGPLARIDGWPITLANLTDAVAAISETAAAGKGFVVCTLNLDHLVKLRHDGRFRKAYETARFITADGAPVARLARFQAPEIKRTTGADLLLPLAARAAADGTPVYLFGTSPGVLARAGRRLAEAFGGRLDIAGTWSPATGFDPESAEADAAIDRISQSGAKLCFVALGAPKQEIFAARAVTRGCKAGFVCIGAGLDFIAGAQVRAPAAFQRAGLEWLWRLATNPVRLAGRYARCAALLADLTLLDPMRQRLAGRRA